MVNLDKLKEKYQSLTTGKGNNDEFLKNFFMMEDGTSLVRILPWKNEDQDFYAQSSIHNFNGTNIHCLREIGKDCPVCDAYFDMWKKINIIGKETPLGKDMAIQARTLRGRKRFYMNCVDRRDESVKILSVGQSLFTKILDCFMDPDYGDITDFAEGFDFKIVKDKKGEWPNYDKSCSKPKSTPAGSAQQIAAWMDELHDIHSLVKLKEYSEIKKIVQVYISSLEEVKQGAQGSGEDEDSDDNYLAHLKTNRASTTEDEELEVESTKE